MEKIYGEMEEILRQFLSLNYENAAKQFISFERQYNHVIDLQILAAYYLVLQQVIQGDLNLIDQIHRDPFRVRSTWISGVNNNFKRRIRRLPKFLPIQVVERFETAIREADLSPALRASSTIGLAQGAALCNHFEKALSLLELGLSLTGQIEDVGDLDDIKEATRTGAIEWFSGKSFSSCQFSLEAGIVFLNWLQKQYPKTQTKLFESNQQLLMEQLMNSSLNMLSRCMIKGDLHEAEQISGSICKLLKHNEGFDSRYYRWDETNSSQFYDSQIAKETPLTKNGIDAPTKLLFLQHLFKIQQLLYGGFHPKLSCLAEKINELGGKCHCPSPLDTSTDVPTADERSYATKVSFSHNHTLDPLSQTSVESKKKLSDLIRARWAAYALGNDGTMVSLEFRSVRRIRFRNIENPTTFTATLTPEAVFSLIEIIRELNGADCLEAFCPCAEGGCITIAAIEL